MMQLRLAMRPTLAAGARRLQAGGPARRLLAAPAVRAQAQEGEGQGESGGALQRRSEAAPGWGALAPFDAYGFPTGGRIGSVGACPCLPPAWGASAGVF